MFELLISVFIVVYCFQVFTIDFEELFCVFLSPVGAILAGLPFSYVAKHLEWKGAFVTLEGLLIGVLVLKVAARNLEYKMVPTKKKLQ